MPVLHAPRRHPELVSGSIVPLKRRVQAEEWTLKQVQGDDLTGLIAALKRSAA